MPDPVSQSNSYTISVEERLELLKKLDRLEYYNRIEDVNDIVSSEDQDSFFTHFELSIIDSVVAFFRQIIFGESIKQFIFKKSIKNEIKYLSSLHPPILDKNGIFVLSPFINFLYEAAKISTDYQNFFKFWKKTIASKNNLISFALYFFDKIKTKENKSYFEQFHEKNLIDIIKNNKDYKKLIAEQISLIKKHIRNNSENLTFLLNQIYNLIIFFTYDFSLLFKNLYPVHFTDFNLEFESNQFQDVHIDKFINSIRVISRLFMVFPYYNELREDSLKTFVEYYNEIFPDNQIDFSGFFQRLLIFTEKIQYYAAKDIVNRLYRVLYKNPLLKVPFFSINLDNNISFEKLIEQALEEKIKEAESIVEQKVFNEFQNLLKEDDADKIKPMDLNESLNSIILKFELPQLIYLKGYLYFYAFFKGIWLNKISYKIFHLIEFKYFIFNQSDLKAIKELIESLNQILVDFELNDKFANSIRIEVMKFEKKLPLKEDIVKLSLLLSNLDSKMKQTLVFGITNINKLFKYLPQDNADSELNILKEYLNKFIDILLRICPYDK